MTALREGTDVGRGSTAAGWMVKRVSRYASFEEMLDAEGLANVNPDSLREQQLADIRRIYGPEKEALGVLAIEIELLQAATT